MHHETELTLNEMEPVSDVRETKKNRDLCVVLFYWGAQTIEIGSRLWNRSCGNTMYEATRTVLALNPAAPVLNAHLFLSLSLWHPKT